MEKDKLQYFKGLLQDEKERREGILYDDQLGLDVSIRDVTGELSSYDNHPADTATETYEAEKNFSFRVHDKFQVSEIDAALKKIEDGSYGNCEVCHKQIDEERLEVLPMARLCIHCENDFEQKIDDEEKGRPIEEKVLYPPFGRSFTDNSTEDSTIFDGEDTWQAVNVYNPVTYDNDYDKDDSFGYVEDVEQISNNTYRKSIE